MKCNILLMGYTGVGKSTLLNYLAGENLAEAGISSSAGGMTRGINKYPLTLSGQPCVVSDSEGLEAKNERYWNDLMSKELLDDDCEKDISDWYHIVVYCIGANGGRVQDIEIDMLHRLDEAGYGVVVALTKSDLASDEELDAIKNAVFDDFLQKFDYYPSFRFVPICSKKTRSGIPEGKENLCEAIFDAWGDTVMNRLPNYLYDPIIWDKMLDWRSAVIKWIFDQDMGFFGRSKDEMIDILNEEIKETTSNFSKEISRKQKSAFKKVKEVYDSLNVVLDTASIAQVDTSFADKIGKLDSTWVYDSHAGSNALMGAGLGVGLVLAPMVTIPLAIATAIFTGSSRAEKRKEETADAFIYQWKEIMKSYLEQQDVLRNSIGCSTIGYLRCYREMAIHYLKGRGVEMDSDKAVEYMETLVDNNLGEEDGWRDAESEYYAGMMLAFAGNIDGARLFLEVSAEDGDEYAKEIIQNNYLSCSESLRELYLKRVDDRRDREYNDRRYSFLNK